MRRGVIFGCTSATQSRARKYYAENIIPRVCKGGVSAQW